jgi:tetratricopeptide (TPR) repeat protein
MFSKLQTLTGCLILSLLLSCGKKSGEGDNPDAGLPEGIKSNKTITRLTEEIKKDPDNADLYYARSRELFREGVYQTAMQDAHRAIDIDSTRPPYYLLLSDIYFTVNQTRKAKEYLERCIRIDDKNVDANMKLAEMYLYVEQHKLSIEYVDKVLKQELRNPKAYFIKGMNFKEMGDTARAISNFQTVVEQDPEYYNAYMQLGKLHTLQNNELAVQYLNTALRLNPRSTEALYARGLYYQNRGDYDNANRDYDSLLRIDPVFKSAYYNKGYILMLNKKYPQAIEEFNMAIQSERYYKEAYYMRGLCYRYIRKEDKAQEDFKMALKIDPDYEMARKQVN